MKMSSELKSDEIVVTGLDDRWITEGLQKRESNFSNIICFETKDPRRFDQLLEYLLHCDYGKDAGLFLYDPWNGLMQYDYQAEIFEPYSREIGGGYDNVPQEVTNLVETLTVMDDELKSRRTTFLIRNVEDRAEPENGRLQDAVKNWALDKRVMEKRSLAILLTGNLSRVLDEQTSSLIALKRPDLSTTEERKSIIRDVGNKLGLSSEKLDEKSESLAIATSGLDLHQVRCVLLESFHTKKRFARQTIKELKNEFIRRTDLVDVRDPEPIFCPECQSANPPSATECEECRHHLEERRGFARVGGYDRVKEFIRDEIIRAVKDPTLFKALGLPLPRGILLFGPPGTGKTLFASALAEEAHIPFINLRTENLYSNWIGESGQKFREAIRLVEQMSPAICFIDELDQFGIRSSSAFESGGGQELRRVFNQVLEWLGDEKRNAIIVGATNRPADLDPAFKRPGRIDYKIPFLYPDKYAREAIFMVHLGRAGPKQSTKLDSSISSVEDLVEELSARTTCYTGAEIEQLVLRAKRRAKSDERGYLTQEDFERALKSFRINWQDRVGSLDFFIKQAEEECDDQELLQDILPNELRVFLEKASNLLKEGRGFSLEQAASDDLPMF